MMGRVTSWAAFVLGIVYAVTTTIGLLSLKTPQDPIGDPFFTMMELLTIFIAPLMAVSMVAVHNHAAPEDKMFSLAALCFMFMMAVITSSVHFVILSVGDQMEAEAFSFFFSFKWPSVVYALDILAWDWFFAISILFASRVFKVGKLEKAIRVLMTLSGVLSIAGLIGIPLESMQVRNIGVIGYAVVAPFVFLLMGIVLGGAKDSGRYYKGETQ